MPSYAMFWGCQIPARLPFVEKATRLILERFQAPVQDLEGFTCCPYKEILKLANEELWYLTSARNMSLAERQGLDLLTPCNGCYATPKEVLYNLKLRPDLRRRIQDVLEKVGLSFQGKARVKHLVEFFHDEIGPSRIRSEVKAPLAGVKVAVHYGCHLVRPNPAINFDDPLRPTKFDAVVEALGAKSVDYASKMLCCGQGFNAVEEPEKSESLPAEKLRELKAMGVKALVTCCPTCFMQYDNKQALLRRQGEEIQIPVFYFSELVALTLGYQPRELGLELHRTDTAPFFEEWERSKKRLSMAREYFDLTLVQKCYQCAGCLMDCPTVKVDPSWNPNAIMGRILQGEVEELIESPEIWQCIDCFLCDALCPQRWSMRQAFDTLRHLAIARGKAPRGVRNAVEAFKDSGKLNEATQSQRGLREKLGLPQAPKVSAGEVARLAQVARDLPFALAEEIPEEMPLEEEVET